MKLITKTQIHSIFSKLTKSKKRARSHTPSQASPTSTRSSSSDNEYIAPNSKSIPFHRNSCPSSSPTSVADLFSLFDRDGDGKITKPELEAVLRRLGPHDPPTDEELALMVADVDRDGDGCISLDELHAIGVDALGSPAAFDELRDTFAVFDTDGDGLISAEELLGVFIALGDGRCTIDECQRMIGGVDSDGDGLVGFTDFARMMDGQR